MPSRVAGQTIHARVSANASTASAPAIVMVHGIGVSSKYLRPTAQLLAANYRAYAPDLPGFGDSDKPRQTLGIHEHGEFLRDWMQEIGLQRATVLGHSLGCQVVADFAAHHPEWTDAVVLAGPTIDPVARSAVAQARRRLRNLTMEKPGQLMINTMDYVRAGPRRVVSTLRFTLEDRIEDHPRQVRAPTLVVRGGRDPITPQRWAEEATRLLPSRRLAVIPGAPHVVNVSAALELSRLIRHFLDDVLTANRATPR